MAVIVALIIPETIHLTYFYYLSRIFLIIKLAFSSIDLYQQLFSYNPRAGIYIHRNLYTPTIMCVLAQRYATHQQVYTRSDDISINICSREMNDT